MGTDSNLAERPINTFRVVLIRYLNKEFSLRHFLYISTSPCVHLTLALMCLDLDSLDCLKFPPLQTSYQHS